MFAQTVQETPARLPRPEPAPPGNAKLITLAIRDTAHDPRDVPSLNALEAHFGALLFDDDVERAHAIVRERRIDPDTLARAFSALTWVRLKHKAIDAVPPVHALTAWVAGQVQQAPTVPKSSRLIHGAAGYVAIVTWDLTFDPRNLPHSRSVRLCLEALFLDHDETGARQAATRIPIDVLLRVDAALLTFGTLYEYADQLEAAKASDAASAPIDMAAAEDAAHAVAVLHAKEEAVLHAEESAVLHVDEAEPQARPAGGRPPKLTPEQRAEAMRLRAEGKGNAEIARVLNVSRSTISRLK